MITQRTVTRLLPLLCVLTWSWGLPARAGETVLKISSGVAWIANVYSRIHEPFEKATGVRIEVDPKGQTAEQIIQQIEEGKAEVGIYASNWEDWLKLSADRGYQPKNPGGIHHAVIGRDRVHVAVHKSVTVPALSAPQLKAIFTGGIRNWKEVGGPDLPVVVVLSAKQPITGKQVSEKVMDGTPIDESIARKLPTNQEMIAAVGTIPGAIGFGPLSLTHEGVRFPEIPEIGRPIVLITRGSPSKNAIALMKFIREEGAKLGVPR